MKFLYHHRTRSKDGQTVHIEELIKALRDQGHEVVLVAPKGIEAAEFGDDAGLVAVLKRMLPAAVYELLELAYSVPAFFRLRAAFRQHRPAVLYERYNLYHLPGVWLRRLYGLPMLLEVNAPLVEERREHGNLALVGLARWVERLTWRTADRVLPVTQVLANHCTQHAVDPRRITVIPNGVGQEFLHLDADAGAKVRRQHGLDRSLVLGFTGFMRPWHGLDRVIDLIADSDPKLDLRLLLVGDGPARQDLARRAESRGVADRIVFTGVVPRHLMPAYVAAFDIALQPHVVPYASPLKLFEYMALGRPIVAPATPNISEILNDGVDALLFDMHDPEAFRGAVERMIGDPALRERLGRGARATVDRLDLTWTGNARRVGELAQSLTSA
jgi:glycosyltransferase involved in cell wall biosynthesis